jgi:hypothetical protein
MPFFGLDVMKCAAAALRSAAVSDPFSSSESTAVAHDTPQREPLAGMAVFQHELFFM